MSMCSVDQCLSVCMCARRSVCLDEAAEPVAGASLAVEKLTHYRVVGKTSDWLAVGLSVGGGGSSCLFSRVGVCEGRCIDVRVLESVYACVCKRETCSSLVLPSPVATAAAGGESEALR